MKNEWLPHTILRAASLLAPGDRRAEWVREWQSELWYIPRGGATRFCLGAFQDALWVRRNNPGLGKRHGLHLESPIGCLAFLSVLAAVSLAIAVRLPAPKLPNMPSHLQARDLPGGCGAMALLSCLMLPVIRLVTGQAPARFHTVPWPCRVRCGVFLALKIALLHPIMLGSFLIGISIGQVLPFVQLGISAAWVLAFRWVLTDQRGRCPVCLRLLTDPVRIGAASRTLLEWYGAESMCARGHGWLHSAEIPSSYSDYPQWHGLDDSWKELFLEGTGRR
jgi:hypothetical protein